MDPITLAVVEGMLASTAREMTVTMVKTCRSPILKLAQDFSNAIFDWTPRMIMQGEDIPNHLGALMFSCKAVAEYFQDDIYPGDVIYHNDPATGGSHLQDMCMYKPIFYKDELMFWIVNKAHMLDTGGPVAGGYNPAAEDLYSEGLRITAVKLYEKGEPRQDVIDFIVNNVRTQRELRGDMQAQFGVLGVAERRLLGLVDKYGVSTIKACIEEILDRAETRMRAVINGMPDGVYRGQALVEDDGRNGESEIGCTIQIEKDSMHIKLKTRPQLNSYINSYEANTTSMVYAGVLAFVDPTLPHNEGLYRPIHLDVGSQGTMTNAQFPAPCACTTSTIGINITDAILDTLSKALPEHAVAAWSHVNTLTITGMNPENNEFFIYFSFNSLMGGAGAIGGMDGWHALGSIAAAGALKCDDIELIESEFPIRVHAYELRPDSGTPGRWRGGMGTVFSLEPLAQVSVTRWGEGETSPDSVLVPEIRRFLAELRKAEYFVSRKNDRIEKIEKQTIELRVNSGDRIVCHVVGGGGVGDPFLRHPTAVRDDVVNGLVTLRSAREEYGVVIDSTTLQIDDQATNLLRE